MESKVIGNYLKAIRLKKGYSEEYVSFKLNISQSTISNFENGKIKMDIRRLVQFCEVLDIHIQELVNFFLAQSEEHKTSPLVITSHHAETPQMLVQRLEKIEQQIAKQNQLLLRLLE